MLICTCRVFSFITLFSFLLLLRIATRMTLYRIYSAFLENLRHRELQSHNR